MSVRQRTRQQSSAIPPIAPVLIDAATLAAWLSTSKSTLYRRLALGQVLRPPRPMGPAAPMGRGRGPRMDRRRDAARR